jgi:hypothetical protein
VVRDPDKTEEVERLDSLDVAAGDHQRCPPVEAKVGSIPERQSKQQSP